MKQFAMLAITLAFLFNLGGCKSVNRDLVEIDAQGVTQLNGKPIPVADISEQLTGDALVIRANSSTSFNKLQAVLDEAKEAGIANVSIATTRTE